MFEQRFDHICADHAQAMEAIEQRIREVVARRGGEPQPASPSGQAPAAGEPAPAEDPRPTRAPASVGDRGPVAVQDPAAASEPVGRDCAVSEQAVDSAPWPERDGVRARGAVFLDSRWNSDLPWG
ncbi:hypothetical protein [Tomitella gaofuii]|uniref:hypothetical protein n=1 Tax=Tomitella gaofuii TaxID=2760083 RepID=UPI0015FA33AE|nr:hypothetical protein [Tomitella gaofuii]